MPYLVISCRCLIGTVFLISSVSKLRRPRAFAASVRELGLLPPSLVAVTAMAAGAAETATWVLLAVPATMPVLIGFLGATGLLAMFTTAIVGAVRRGVRAPCGCFGGASTAPLGVRHVVRNSALAAVAVLGSVALARPGPVLPGGTVAAVLAGLALAGGVVAVDRVADTLGRRAEAPADGARQRPKPSITTGEDVPAFSAVTVDGEHATSDGLPDDTLVGFFSVRCRICAARLPAFLAYAQGMPGGRRRVLAVVISDGDDTAAVVAELRPVARVVVEDRHGALKAAFQVRGYPTTLLVGRDRAGRLVVKADRPAPAAT